MAAAAGSWLFHATANLGLGVVKAQVHKIAIVGSAKKQRTARETLSSPWMKPQHNPLCTTVARASTNFTGN